MFDAVRHRWGAGAHLVFASAAAIALSRFSLPVYEIYKVGRELHWAEGLDLLGPRGFPLAIVTHWNNAEGGTNDTRACFMGMERFGQLQAILPPDVVVLGIDEHTACTLDMDGGQAEVRGKGGITILRGEVEERHPSGEVFPVDALQSRTPTPAIAARTIPRAEPASSPAAVGQASDDLAVLLQEAAAAAERAGPTDDELGPLMEVFIELRSALRERGEWALADGLRDRLLAVGIELRDTPEGTIWAVAQGMSRTRCWGPRPVALRLCWRLKNIGASLVGHGHILNERLRAAGVTHPTRERQGNLGPLLPDTPRSNRP